MTITTSASLLLDRLETPIGVLALVVDSAGSLRAAGFLTEHARMGRHLAAYAGRSGVAPAPATDPQGVTSKLRAYFAGDLAAIDDLAVASEGTPFQRRVWAALRSIPCGETWSYGQLARHLDHPTAVRAVGLANGANPVAIVVPCHRVIGSDGSLTGYGGGIERKRWLLSHEGVSDRARESWPATAGARPAGRRIVAAPMP
jgi:methylated-DNA-[protein]-cysteine S-methyltransferase